MLQLLISLADSLTSGHLDALVSELGTVTDHSNGSGRKQSSWSGSSFQFMLRLLSLPFLATDCIEPYNFNTCCLALNPKYPQHLALGVRGRKCPRVKLWPTVAIHCSGCVWRTLWIRFDVLLAEIQVGGKNVEIWPVKVLSICPSRELGLLYTLCAMGLGKLFKHR